MKTYAIDDFTRENPDYKVQYDYNPSDKDTAIILQVRRGIMLREWFISHRDVNFLKNSSADWNDFISRILKQIKQEFEERSE